MVLLYRFLLLMYFQPVVMRPILAHVTSFVFPHMS
jgi:hypothetical protein